MRSDIRTPDTASAADSAETLFQKGLFDDALFAFRRRADCDDWPALNGVAECLVRLGRGDEAIDPKNRWLRTWLADPSTQNLRTRQRAAIARGAPGILILSMPKSGSTFTKICFEESLDLPSFLPTSGSLPECPILPAGLEALSRGGIVARLHSLPSERNLKALRNAGIGRVIVLQRDPEAAALSWARSWARYDDAAFAYAAPLIPGGVRQDFRELPPSSQADWALEHIAPSMEAWAAAWEPYRNDPRFGFVHYDDLKRDEDKFLDTCAEIVGIEPGIVRAKTPREQMPNWGGAQSVR